MTHHTIHIPEALLTDLQGVEDVGLATDVPLSSLTTMGVGGPVGAVIHINSMTAVQEVTRLLRHYGTPWRIVGRGSNIIAGDTGWNGCILRLSGEFLTISHSAPESKITVGAGVMLPQLFSWCLQHEYKGVEFLAGIPGTVGGAVVMNAGAWKREMGDIIAAVTVLLANGEIKTLTRDHLSFSYRRWHGPHDAVVLKACLHLEKGLKKTIRATSQKLLDQRRNRQPLSLASSGSFFKNPQGMSAGRLIDTAGLKGMQHGGAMVSHEHANFIVNTGNATAEDILSLMHAVQKKVEQQFSIRLEPEVHFLACPQTVEETV